MGHESISICHILVIKWYIKWHDDDEKVSIKFVWSSLLVQQLMCVGVGASFVLNEWDHNAIWMNDDLFSFMWVNDHSNFTK